MNKYLICAIFCLVASCTSLSTFDKIDAIKTFKISKNTLLQIIKDDNINKIDDFFVYGIRNNIILREIKKYDIKGIFVVIPEKSVKVISKNKIESLLLLNNSFDTMYFNVIWKKYGNIWKIYSIYEK